jgi:hypothetical protein
VSKCSLHDGEVVTGGGSIHSRSTSI